MDKKNIIFQNSRIKPYYPWMEISHPWMEKNHPWMEKKSSMDGIFICQKKSLPSFPSMDKK